MRRIEKELILPEWEMIFKQWKYSCESLYEPITSDIGIMDIFMKPSSYITLPRFDWWPIANIKSSIENNNVSGYGLNKGTMHTLELLLEFKDNPEGIAATWIAASLKDKLDDYPEAWRGPLHRLVHETYYCAVEKIEELGGYEWHFASRNALPLTLFKGMTSEFRNDIRISSWVSLISWVALENVLVRTTWTIVRILDKENIRFFTKDK